VTPADEAPLDPSLAPPPPPAEILSNWQQALQLASAEDPDYSVALLEVTRLRGARRQTLAGTLPIVSASGVVTFALIRADLPNINPDTGELETITLPLSPVANFSVSLRQPLLAPRVWWAIGTADAQVEAAELSIEARKRVLVAAVADAIVSVVTAERIAEVNRIGLTAAIERLRLQNRRKELGAGTDLDLLRFEQDVVSARSTIITGDETLKRARERLGLALGTTKSYGVSPDISIDEIQETLGRICEKGDLVDRADLKLLAKQKAIAERALTDADLLYSPTAELSSTFNYSSERILGSGHASWSVQGLLSIPIWDGGARYGAKAVAEAAVQQASERIDGTTRSATIEVVQAERGVTVAQESMDIAQATRDLAKRTEELTQRAFDEGAPGITSFELVEASRRLRETELTLTVRELELVRAKITALIAARNCTT
jgi:outer membrane protein TolC